MPVATKQHNKFFTASAFTELGGSYITHSTLTLYTPESEFKGKPWKNSTTNTYYAPHTTDYWQACKKLQHQWLLRGVMVYKLPVVRSEHVRTFSNSTHTFRQSSRSQQPSLWSEHVRTSLLLVYLSLSCKCISRSCLASHLLIIQNYS